MRFHELSAGALINGSAILLEIDYADPLSSHLGHGSCAADDAEAVVDQPD